MQKKKITKRTVLYKACSTLCVLCLAVGSLSACKKENKQEGEVVSPTAAADWEGFDEANSKLVAQREKEYEAVTAVSVGDMDISMKYAMFFIYTMEVQGNGYGSYYQSYGIDYWEMAFDEEGHTIRDIFKEETMNMLIQYAVMYDCAKKNNMSLNEAEVKECDAFVEELKAVMSAEEAERGGFSTESLREICTFMMLAEKYYTKMTDSLGITKEGVKETINKEDYKEYETEYLYLATTYYDDDYNICEESDEVKESRKAQMLDYFEQVSGGAAFSELAEKDDTLVHNTRTFLENGEGAEKEYIEASKLLGVGDISEPIQTEYGYYVIRMLDDECTKSYEAAVESEYELQRSEAFAAAYDVLLSEYDVKINEAEWGNIILGATVSILE